MSDNKIFNAFSNKKNSGNLIFGICCVAFYGLGTVTCNLSDCIDDKMLSFCPSFGELDSIPSLFSVWFLNFLPLIMVFIWGYSYFGNILSALVIGLRAFLSGFSSLVFLNSLSDDHFQLLYFVLYIVIESLIMLILVSGAVEQSRFRICYSFAKISPFRFMFGRIYIKNFCFRYGVLTFVYLIRCFICFAV